MTSLKTLAIAGAVAIGATGAAFAGDLPSPPPPPMYDAPLRGTVSASGLYLRGDIGVALTNHKPGLEYIQDGKHLGLAPNSTFKFLDSSLDRVAFAALGVGYQFNNWLRFDVTGEFRTTAGFRARDEFIFNGPRSFDPAGTVGRRLNNSLNGGLSTTLLMANGYVDLGTFCALGCLTPFVGAGVGIANHKFSSVTDVSSTTTFGAGGAGNGPSNTFTDAFGSKTRTNLAWSLMAGVGVDVTRNVKLEIGYRYLNMGRAETGSLGLSDPPNTILRVKNIDSHDLRIGMRWLLNSDCCASAPVEQPIFAAPRPMTRKF